MWIRGIAIKLGKDGNPLTQTNKMGLIANISGGSRAAAKSNMECFVIIVAALDPPLNIIRLSVEYYFLKGIRSKVSHWFLNVLL